KGVPPLELDRARRLAVHKGRTDPGGAALLRGPAAGGRTPGDADHGRRRASAAGGRRGATPRRGPLPDPWLLPPDRRRQVVGGRYRRHRRGVGGRQDEWAARAAYRLRSGRQHGSQEAPRVLLMAAELSSSGQAAELHAQNEGRELLRFITCGSVDDGKSTLMGRLLYDADLLHDDSLAAVVADSGRWGTTGERPDLALLVDGLQSEREQGITIDVAYRYFSTPKRKFIMADTPGHEQYTRNMATGASTANLAIILVDARKGVITQTRRQSFISALLGIPRFLVALNKMDLVDFSVEVFTAIREEYTAFASRLGVREVRFVPISALLGD